MRKDKFNIIRFESENNGFERYFPKGLEMSGIWYDLIQIDSFKELIKTKLPLGKSRYGGIHPMKYILYRRVQSISFAL